MNVLGDYGIVNWSAVVNGQVAYSRYTIVFHAVEREQVMLDTEWWRWRLIFFSFSIRLINLFINSYENGVEWIIQIYIKKKKRQHFLTSRITLLALASNQKQVQT